MTRVKRGVNAHKHREKILKLTKGFRWGRSKKERAAKEALLHAGTHAFAGRKEKKRNYRNLWTVRINAGSRAEGISYSKLIHGLKIKKVGIDRKILANLAKEHPEVFKKIIAAVK